jgi:hypothetical protein
MAMTLAITVDEDANESDIQATSNAKDSPDDAAVAVDAAFEFDIAT